MPPAASLALSFPHFTVKIGEAQNETLALLLIKNQKRSHVRRGSGHANVFCAPKLPLEQTLPFDSIREKQPPDGAVNHDGKGTAMALLPRDPPPCSAEPGSC